MIPLRVDEANDDWTAVAPTIALGLRVRHAREASRLTLAEVAERTGLTKGFLSRIENDAASPSVSSLIQICQAIGIEVGSLFATPPTTLVRAVDRPAIDGLPGASAVDTLITPGTERHVTVIETAVAPGGSGGDELYTLRSECEVAFVIEGQIEVTVEGATFDLGEGDALVFGASAPHTWRNLSPTSGARVLWILAPALPDPLAEPRPKALP